MVTVTIWVTITGDGVAVTVTVLVVVTLSCSVGTDDVTVTVAGSVVQWWIYKQLVIWAKWFCHNLYGYIRNLAITIVTARTCLQIFCVDIFKWGISGINYKCQGMIAILYWMWLQKPYTSRVPMSGVSGGFRHNGSLGFRGQPKSFRNYTYRHS